MKKLTLAIIMVLSSFSIASAELGIKVGVSAEIGTMETKGSETSSAVGADNQETKTIEALFANGGGFIEKELNFLPGPLAKLSFLSIGYSNIAHDLNLGKSSNMRLDKNVPSGAFTTTVEREHSVAGKVTDFQQIYALANIKPWLFVKAGVVDLDVNVKFKGTTGTTASNYKENHSLSGNMFGAGVHLQNDQGLFFRAEVNEYKIDGKSEVNQGTDSTFTIKVNDIEGTTGRFSIGKRF